MYCGGRNRNSVFTQPLTQRAFRSSTLDLDNAKQFDSSVLVVAASSTVGAQFANKSDAWSWAAPPAGVVRIWIDFGAAKIVVQLQPHQHNSSISYHVLVAGLNAAILSTTSTRIETEIPVLSAGRHRVVVNATGYGIIASNETIEVPLVISNVSPTAGSVVGGQLVTVSGADFAHGSRFADNLIDICGVPCTATFATSTMVTCTTGPKNTELELPVSATTLISIVRSNDDGYQTVTDSLQEVELTNTTLLMGVVDQESYLTFLRFRGIRLAHWDTLLSACVHFHASTETLSSPIQLEIRASLAEESQPLVYHHITTGFVMWSLQAWAQGKSYQTPDLKHLFQEIMNHTSWQRGSDVVLRFSVSSGLGTFAAVAWDNEGGANAPELMMETVTTTASFIGLDSMAAQRCNVTVHVGTTINSVEEETCTPKNVAIRGKARVLDGAPDLCRPAHLSLFSAGQADSPGPHAYIELNGVSVHNCSRGINVVVLDSVTKVVLKASSFDTGQFDSASSALALFLGDEVCA